MSTLGIILMAPLMAYILFGIGGIAFSFIKDVLELCREFTAILKIAIRKKDWREVALCGLFLSLPLALIGSILLFFSLAQ